MSCRRCIVTGRVQGVFFRESTRRKAMELEITGWALNRPDGSVEVVACGTEAAVEALVEWLWTGPPLAQVAHVACEPAPETAPPATFTTGWSADS